MKNFNSSMFKRSLYVALSVFVLGIGVFFIYTIYSAKTTRKYNEEHSGETIHDFGDYYRKFILKNRDGSYVIQDFYKEGNMPRSNPYTIRDRADLSKEYADQTSIDGLHVFYDTKGSHSHNKQYVYYVNGVKNGPAFNLFREGAIDGRSYYLDNAYDGIKTEFFTDGKKYSEANFINGELNGTVSWWYANGQIKDISKFKNGRLEHLIGWYDDGSKSIEYSRTANSEYFTTWYRNSHVSSELSLLNKVPSKCSEFKENGEIVFKDESSQQICEELYRKEYYRTTIESR